MSQYLNLYKKIKVRYYTYVKERMIIMNIYEFLKGFIYCAPVTYLVTLYMNYYSITKYLKFIGENGYKLNDSKTDEYINEFSYFEDKEKLKEFLCFLPYFNMFITGTETLEFNSDMESELRYEILNGSVIEMNEEEYETFMKNPTYINLIKISNPKSYEDLEDFNEKLEELIRNSEDDTVLTKAFKYGDEYVFVYFKEENKRVRK